MEGISLPDFKKDFYYSYGGEHIVTWGDPSREHKQGQQKGSLGIESMPEQEVFDIHTPHCMVCLRTSF